jgi:hypothetical protein
MALVVHELTDALHHGGGLQPEPVLRGKFVDRLKLVEELDRVFTLGFGGARVDAVTAADFEDTLPALCLHGAVSDGPSVDVGEHLSQDAVTQAEWRVAEAL